MPEKTERRITELEIRLTHQVDLLKLKIEIIEKRLKTAAESQVADQKDETPPPHY